MDLKGDRVAVYDRGKRKEYPLQSIIPHFHWLYIYIVYKMLYITPRWHYCSNRKYNITSQAEQSHTQVKKNVGSKEFWVYNFFGYNKFYGLKIFVDPKNVVPEKMLVPNKCWSQTNLVLKQFGSRKIFGLTFFWVQQSFGSKTFGVQNSFWVPKKFKPPTKFESKKIWIQKNCGPKILSLKNFVFQNFWITKNVGPKKIWVQVWKNVVPKRILGPKEFCVQKYSYKK